jgi:paraquat-inducible protein B
MKSEVRPTLIGLFVLGAVFLAAGTVIFVGSMKLFSREQVFVLYFDESVNGLSVGSPVKFKGVPVGKVSDIRTRYNQSGMTSAIPVFIRINEPKSGDSTGIEARLSNPYELTMQIRMGLRAKLELESLITGQLFVELDYTDDPRGNPPRFVQTEDLYSEIPTEPSILARFGMETSDLFAQLTSIQYDEIGSELLQLLRVVRDRLEPLDTVELQGQLSSILSGIDELIHSEDLKVAIDGLGGALAAIEKTGTVAQEELASISHELHSLSQSLDASLIPAREALESLNVALHPSSPVRSDLNRLLRELTRLMNNLADFADLMERNPASLLRGREMETP